MTAQRRTNINLLPSEDQDSSILGRVMRWALSTFRFLVISVELVVIIGFLSRFFLDSQNADLNEEIDQKAALIEAYLSFENEFKDYQKRAQIYTDYASSSAALADYYQGVTQFLGSDLQLVSINRRENNLEIQVTGFEDLALARFQASLSTLPNVKSVSVSGIESLDRERLLKETFVVALNEN